MRQLKERFPDLVLSNMTVINNHLDGSNIYPLPGQQKYYALLDYEVNNFNRLEGGIASLFQEIMGINCMKSSLLF